MASRGHREVLDIDRLFIVQSLHFDVDEHGWAPCSGIDQQAFLFYLDYFKDQRADAAPSRLVIEIDLDALVIDEALCLLRLFRDTLSRGALDDLELD